jgi:hypothetical protein
LWKCEQELVQMCVYEKKRQKKNNKAIGDKWGRGMPSVGSVPKWRSFIDTPQVVYTNAYSWYTSLMKFEMKHEHMHELVYGV